MTEFDSRVSMGLNCDTIFGSSQEGDTTPNLGIPADRDPRERGSRPLNTDR